MNQHTHTASADFLDGYACRGGPSTLYLIEAQVIGSIIAGTLDLADAVAALDPEHFEDPMHGLIFAALGDGPEPARDLEALRQHFDGTGALDDAGGPAYLLQLRAHALGNPEADLAADMQAIRAAGEQRETRRETIRHGVG